MFNFFNKKPKPKKIEPKTEKDKQTEEFVSAVRKLASEKNKSRKVFDEAIKFELEFYGIIAGHDNFRILPVPEGEKELKEEELQEAHQAARLEGARLVYQMDNQGKGKNISIIFGPYTDITGIIYPTDGTGYHA